MTTDDGKEWVLSHGRSDGLPIYMRVRATLPATISRSEFPHNLIVTWEYEPEHEGLPDDDTLKSMELMEDLLMATLSQEHDQCHLLVVTTSNGIRQWLWKSRDPENAVSLFGQALGGHPPFPIGISADKDPDWAIYETYLHQSGTTSG